MTSILFSISLALAAPADDLALATRKDLDEATRMAAFERLVDAAATDQALILKVSADPDADARQRWVAIRALGQAGGARAQQALHDLLSDDMPAIRVAAAQALGDLGDRGEVPAITPLLADPAMLVRAAAATALGQLGDPAAVPALATAYGANDNHYRGTSLWVRRYYIDAMGQIGHRSAYPSLLLALDDPDPTVSAAAVDALESVARFSFADGRDEAAEREAWRRWVANELRAPR